MNSHLSRRDVLKLGAGAAAALLAAGCAEQKEPTTMTQTTPKKIPVGLQLYSIRNQAAKDLPGVLAAVGKMGYAGVEFAGYYGWEKKPKDLRKLLDDSGLKACGTHTALDQLKGDKFKTTVELHQTLGAPFVIVPYLPHERFASTAAAADLAKEFNALAEQLKPEGLGTGYHAHGGDFVQVEGKTAWEQFFDQTSPDVIMQMDIGNCLDGKGDPYTLLRKYPGKSKTIHIKEHGGPKGAVIGEGEIKWNEIFAVCEGPGGTQWYVIEHESDPTNPLDSVKRCLEGLRKLGRG